MKPRATILLALLLFAGALFASDHADPVVLDVKEAGITDLFFFPHGDDMILIFNLRPGLNMNPPFKLDPFEYAVHIDLHSQLSFDNASDKARYGGTVVNPNGIKPDVTFQFTLNNDASLKSKTITGLANPERIRVWTGVRDDPFIFPRFFKKNTIATVWAIPKSSFPAGQQDFILWGTSSEHGKQIDNVGRSNRSQNGRYGFIATIPPDKQMAALQKQFDKTTKVYNFLNRENLTLPLGTAYHVLLQMYPFDLTVPDVMIYTTRFPVGYPNGRLLTDDVAYISCQYGDCVLMSLSYAESPQFPRATVNDKPFLADFPFLADPWPAAPPPPSKGMGCGSLALIVLVLLVVIVIAIIWWRKARKKQYPTLAT